MSFISELRRRNVFRVGIAYLVVAWLLLQVVDVVAPMLALPDWAGRLVLLLLMVGFPVALILAWAFELTPEGLKRDSGTDVAQPAGGRRRVSDVAVLLALTAGVGFFALNQLTGPEPAATAPPDESSGLADVPARLDGISIAVLPFLNISPDADQEYFSDGISEELLNVLSRAPGLRVASRTSAFAFKGEHRNLTEIADILRVAYIVEGSVRKSGKRIRITAQLIDAANDRHLWSETYDRELTDIFAIQDEISDAIVASLAAALGFEVTPPVASAAATENMDAYDLFLQARSLGSVLSLERKRRQVALLQRAVGEDPGFTRGWTELAWELAVLPSWDHSLDTSEYQIKARSAAARALEIDPASADTYMVLARIAYDAHEWREWQANVARAVELAPNILTTDPVWIGMAGEQWLGLGYLNRTLELATAGLAIQPDNSFLQLMKGIALLDLGRTDEALEPLEQAMLLGYAGTAQGLIWGYYVEGPDEVIWTALTSEYLRDHDRDLFPLLPHMKRVRFASAQDQETEIRRFWRVAEELGFSRDDLLGQGPRWGPRLGRDVLRRLGEFEPIAESFWTNSPKFWMWTPGMGPFRQSDAFRDRVRSSGMLGFWQENGWPDLCRPADETDFVCD